MDGEEMEGTYKGVALLKYAVCIALTFGNLLHTLKKNQEKYRKKNSKMKYKLKQTNLTTLN